MPAAARHTPPSGPLRRPRAAATPAADTPPACDATPLVFVLDDEPIVQAILRAVLERGGFQVHASPLWSEIGRELMAVRAARRAVLVSDLNLPGIRGEDFCRTVLKYRPTLDLVLYTGVDAADARDAARRLGAAVRFVLKKEGPDRLVEVVRELAGRGA